MRLGTSDQLVADVRDVNQQNQDLLLEWLTDGHFDVDEAWRFTGISERAAQLLGFPAEALEGRVLWEVFPAALGTLFERECRAAMLTRKPGQFEGPALEHLDSSTTVYLDPISPGLRLYYRDSMEWEETQAALRESEAKYRKLVSLLPAAVYTCDAEGRITLFNARAAELWGREPRLFDEDDKYCGSFRLYTTDQQPLQHSDCWMARALKTATPVRGDKIIIERPDGSRILALANVDPLFDDNGKLVGAINVLQDVTHQSRVEHQLEELSQTLERRIAERTSDIQQLADQLRALTAERTRLEQKERRRLALVLHDHVQQLLVAARMQVETIIRQTSLEASKSAAQQAASILMDAIASSRTLSAELSPPVLYQSGLTGGLAWLADQMEQKYQFKVHLHDKTEGKLVSEPATLLLFESTQELLLNCVHHSGAGEAHVTLTWAGEQQIRVTVEDHGRGFDLKSLNRKKPKLGSVGLFSIQQRLGYFGGRMEIDAVPGKGVRVTLVGPPEERE
ncbi:MAG: PAS domain S-box protein [Acidobacteria bacterium]|nr:MAG: PAS domain S-box protein [Acidobacteriota bacterium]